MTYHQQGGPRPMNECRVYCLGFLSLAHWRPPIDGTRWTWLLDWHWSWWPRPGYHQFRFWKPLPKHPISGLSIRGEPVYEEDVGAA